ncbi:MAG: hypothetical protein A2498_15855 [Lentisphaerae bacterium RIFOXYC12_FULL_60_16]|nr:MAG: hypothetical protein A2498_15855 [Lentisphaerae bacterium RIFOXYC12_FULL_60_16]OGV79150.1 MAG: hypothetical protein A2340_03435 [Lentisphaerae bacterium RIFOXYB12_FULL_60_10]
MMALPRLWQGWSGVGLTVLVVSLLWFGGPVGAVLTRWVIPSWLPATVSDVRINRWISGDHSVPDGSMGIVLYIHPDRIRTLLHEVSPWSWLLPGGLIPDESWIEGNWRPRSDEWTDPRGIPIGIRISRSTGPAPRLTGRFSSAQVNRMLDATGGLRWDRRKEWMLGHYRMLSNVRFDWASIRSEPAVADTDGVTRRLRLDAGGWYRVELVDGKLQLRSTARVEQLKGWVDIRFEPAGDHLRSRYEARLTHLEAKARNWPPWAESWTSESLKSSLEDSLNREKSRRKWQSQRFPVWLPHDLDLDLECVTIEPEAGQPGQELP